MDPAEHYLTYGFRMGRNPNEFMSTHFVRTAFGMKTDDEPIGRLATMTKKAGSTPLPDLSP